MDIKRETKLQWIERVNIRSLPFTSWPPDVQATARYVITRHYNRIKAQLPGLNHDLLCAMVEKQHSIEAIDFF